MLLLIISTFFIPSLSILLTWQVLLCQRTVRQLYNCARSFIVSLNFLNSNNYFVRARKTKECLSQPSASLVGFVLPFSSDLWLCFQLIAISFQRRPQEMTVLPHQAPFRLEVILNRLTVEVICHVNVIFVCITTTVIARRVPMKKSGI